MDSIENPFSPGAGSPPPELVGRDLLLEEINILLERVKRKRAEKSVFLIGLRGVGKTVLLNHMRRLTQQSGYKTVFIEAHENKSLALLLIPTLRELLYQLDWKSSASRRGLAVLKSFANGLKIKLGDVEFGLDIEGEHGAADSGDIEIDLPNLLVAVAEVANEKDTLVALFIDEVQYCSSKEISALIMAMHRMQQMQLPLVLIAAGLPVMPAYAGESKSYAERLFRFPDIGALSKDDADKALRDPVAPSGVEFTDDALTEIFHLTHGYPYFIQEWGYQTWNHAQTSKITLQVVKEATPDVIRRLDKNFFRVRFDRLTPSDKNFLRAMAELCESSQLRIKDIASLMGVNASTLSPVRAKLIKKGMIYSPSYGDIAFTVPLFRDFMRRIMPQFPAIDAHPT